MAFAQVHDTSQAVRVLVTDKMGIVGADRLVPTSATPSSLEPRSTPAAISSVAIKVEPDALDDAKKMAHKKPKRSPPASTRHALDDAKMAHKKPRRAPAASPLAGLKTTVARLHGTVEAQKDQIAALEAQVAQLPALKAQVAQLQGAATSAQQSVQSPGTTISRAP